MGPAAQRKVFAVNQPKTALTRVLSVTVATVMAMGLSLAIPTVAQAAGVDDITISTAATDATVTLGAATSASAPSNINNVDLQNLLTTPTSVTITTVDGNITVSDPMNWAGSSSSLALRPNGDIAINANLTGYALSPIANTPGANLLTVASGVTINMSNTLMMQDWVTATVAGSITGTGSVAMNTAGDVIMSGNNTYTGDTVIITGTLVQNTPFTVASGATMWVGVFAGASSNLVNNSLLTLNGPLTNFGTVTNSGLIVVGPGGALDGADPLNSLIFDANGGTGTFTAAEVGTSFDLTKLKTFSMEPTWAGHTFLGWSAVPDFGAIVTSPFAFTPGQTLYAQWSTAPSIGTDSLPDGTVGQAYSQQLALLLGVGRPMGALTWKLAGGALPPGLTLSAGGLISGTPTTAGTFTFTVMVSNDYESDAVELTITIVEAPTRPPLAPPTGDGLSQQGWFTTLLIALLGVALTLAWGLRLSRQDTW